MGEEAEVADAYKSLWQHVKQKAAHELVGRNCELPLLIAMCGVAPAKRYLVFRERDQSVIRDGYPMSVRAEITQGLIGAAERAFAVDNPIFDEH